MSISPLGWVLILVLIACFMALALAKISKQADNDMEVIIKRYLEAKEAKENGETGS